MPQKFRQTVHNAQKKDLTSLNISRLDGVLSLDCIGDPWRWLPALQLSCSHKQALVSCFSYRQLGGIYSTSRKTIKCWITKLKHLELQINNVINMLQIIQHNVMWYIQPDSGSKTVMSAVMYKTKCTVQRKRETQSPEAIPYFRVKSSTDWGCFIIYNE